MHEVQLEEIRLEEQIEYLLYITEERAEPLRFVELLRRPHVRLEWIVTFLAMLELMRQGRIVVMQDVPLGEIWIVTAPPGGGDRAEGSPAPDEEGPMEGVA
jgi:segregation and condensation protein A